MKLSVASSSVRRPRFTVRVNNINGVLLANRMARRIAQIICFFLVQLIGVIEGMNVYSRECFADRYCFSLILNEGRNGSNLIDAQNSCRSIRSQLAEVRSRDIQDYIAEFMANASSVISNVSQKNVLINAKLHRNTTWFWVNGRPEGNVDVSGDQNVARIIWRNGSIAFESAQPTESCGYICEYPGKNVSRRMCTFEHNARCFYVSNDTGQNWFSARNRCLESDGDLASFVGNNSDFDSLNASVWLNQTTKYWIGLRKTWWTWQGSDTEVKYTNWKSDVRHNNSNFTCVSLNFTSTSLGQWMTIACDSAARLHYLCLREKYRNKTTASTPTTTITMNSATSANTLALGLGVGLGVSVVLLIIVVVILVVFIIRKRLHTNGIPSSEETNAKETNANPLYAEVKKHKEEDGGTSEDNSASAAAAAAAASISASQTPYATVKERQTTSSATNGYIQGNETLYVNFDIVP